MATTNETVRAKTAVKVLDASLEDVLRWGGKTGGTEHSLVNLAEVRAAKDAEMAAKQTQAETATGDPDKRKVRAGRTRQARSSQRVKLDFRLLPADREVLQEVQDWVDAQREKVNWVPPADWSPEATKKGKEPGTITYQTPVGWVDNIPANDFRQMTKGLMAWRVPNPEPRYSDQREMADKLANLSFQDQACRLCGWQIERGQGPEMAQIRKLLNGRFVLPYINHHLSPGQEELRFRRLHLLCSLWEEELTVILIEIPKATDEVIVEKMQEAAGNVFVEAKKRNPSVSEDDVYAALDTVLANWEQEENQHG